MTPDGHLWLLFNSQFEDAKLVWFDLAGNLLEVDDTPYAEGWPAALDSKSIFYLCGYLELGGPECRALTAQSASPRWQLKLPKANGIVNGSALVAGRLYLTTTGGHLFVMKDLAATQ